MLESQLMQLRFFSRDQQKIIALPKRLLLSETLPPNRMTQITFGHRQATARLSAHNGPEQEIWISTHLAKQLLIPYPDKLWIKGELNNLSIGPVVGILTNDIQLKMLEKPSSLRTKYFRTFLQAQHTAERGACYFIFNLNTVDWNNLTVEGIFWRPDNKNGYWETKTVPFPDVLYNKIANRFEERKPETRAFFENLPKRTHCKLFNEGYFQKWDIYQRLSQVPRVADLIPETYYMPTIREIQYLLNKYGMIYLKPVDGFLGLGIYQLTLGKENTVIARFRKRDINIARRYTSLTSLINQESLQQKLRRYVAQQGIRLIKFNGNPMDFRVHMNKNANDEWEVTGIGAKIAGRGSVTTHIRSGGQLASTDQVFSTLFGQNADRFQEKLIEVCITIAKALESTSNSIIGELGLDVGIDENGKIWMFEANAIPGRSIFKIPSLKHNDLYSAGLILDYSTRLTNFV